MTIPHSQLPLPIPASAVLVSFGPGNLAQLGAIARSLQITRALIVSDPGIVATGHPHRAADSLQAANIQSALFGQAAPNPTTDHVAAGVEFARAFAPQLIIGLGGGSAMDCAKGINFILTNGGRMQDYWGINKAQLPMLPMVCIPTTAGTGSEAQSFALITDPATHQKMACGDKKALPRIAILDPDLTATTPPQVAAATGIDAIAHAVETSACTKRTQASRSLSRQAWELLSASFPTSMQDRACRDAREKMLAGAHLAGAAIENAMLGAAHAAANPLTASFDIVHGQAVGIMLPHIVLFNAAHGQNPYADLASNAESLAQLLEHFLHAAALPTTLRAFGIFEDAIPQLSESAAKQWTASFNPRPVTAADFAELYRLAI